MVDVMKTSTALSNLGTTRRQDPPNKKEVPCN
jgi:hypothetical protein